MTVPTTDETSRLLSSGSHDSANGNIKKKDYQGWTKSLREHADNHKEIAMASILLRDVITHGGSESTAKKAKSYSGKDSLDEEASLAFSKMSQVSRMMLSMRGLWVLTLSAVYILVALSFIEHPRWCQHLYGEDDCLNLFAMRGEVGNDEGTVSYYPNFGMLFLNPKQSWNVEWACLIVLLFHTLLLVGRDGSFGKFFEKESGVRMIRVLQFGSEICLGLGMILHSAFGWSRPLVLFLRLLIFISFSKDIQREIIVVIKIVSDISSSMFILLVVIAFYGWFGVTAFNNTPEGFSQFPNLIEGMWTLWICVTTANYPDVMMPALNENPFVVIYFVSFMIFTFFFLMNIILSIVVNTYSMKDEEYEQEWTEHRTRNLNNAFKLLDWDNTGEINKSSVMAIFTTLNEDCPDIRYIPLDMAELLFAILDKDGSSTINMEEFMQFGQIMLLEFESASLYETFVEKRLPKVFSSTWYQKLHKNIMLEKFDPYIDVILVLNAIVAFIQSFPELTGKTPDQDAHISDGEIDTIWEFMEALFTLIYFVEMTVKIVVMGWKRYSESIKNMFDFIVTILAVVSTIYVYYPNNYSDSRLIRFVVMARVLRLVRVMAAMKSFQLIAVTFLKVLPAAKRITLLLFSIMYAFSALGMVLFGGKITRDPSNPLSEALDGTDFADNDYWANNFNDMMSGMNGCFNLLVVNNWTEQSSGIIAVTGTKWSRLFFLAFHIFGVVIMCNLVIAIIIDKFMDQYGKGDEENDGAKFDNGEGVVVHGEKVFFNAAKISGTDTNLSGDYIAKMRGGSSTSVLSDFFTKSSSNLTVEM